MIIRIERALLKEIKLSSTIYQPCTQTLSLLWAVRLQKMMFFFIFSKWTWWISNQWILVFVSLVIQTSKEPTQRLLNYILCLIQLYTKNSTEKTKQGKIWAWCSQICTLYTLQTTTYGAEYPLNIFGNKSLVSYPSCWITPSLWKEYSFGNRRIATLGEIIHLKIKNLCAFFQNKPYSSFTDIRDSLKLYLFISLFIFIAFCPVLHILVLICFHFHAYPPSLLITLNAKPQRSWGEVLSFRPRIWY